MIRAVLDTNVLVSALLFRGRTHLLHSHWRAGRIRLLIADESFGELARVLAYPKFALAPQTITGLLVAEVAPFRERVEMVPEPSACRDPSDDRFLWTARDWQAAVLVTGDADLLGLRPAWCGVRILTVAEFLGEMDGATRVE